MTSRSRTAFALLLACAIATSASAAFFLGQPIDDSPEARPWDWYGCSGTSISMDGRWVAYATYLSGQVPNDTDDSCEVFVRDMQNGTVARISPVTPRSLMSGAERPAISRDGRWVAYRLGHEMAETLGAQTLTLCKDAVVLHDRDTDHDGVFDEAGATSDVPIPYSGDCSYPMRDNTAYHADPIDISADGRVVVFPARTAPLAADWDPFGPILPSSASLFVLDRDTDRDGVFDEPGATRTSVVVTLDQTHMYSYTPKHFLSTDGRFVAYSQWRPGQDPASYNPLYDTWVLDVDAGTRERVQRPGVEPTNTIEPTAISGDGRYLLLAAYRQTLDTLNPVVTDSPYETFAHLLDRSTGVFTLLATQTDVLNRTIMSGASQITDDGRWILLSAAPPSISPSVGYFRLTDRTHAAADVPLDAVGGAPGRYLHLSADGRYLLGEGVLPPYAHPHLGMLGEAVLWRVDLRTADLEIAVGDPGEVANSGGLMTFPIGVTNHGTSAVSGAWFSVPLPESQFPGTSQENAYSFVDANFGGRACDLEYRNQSRPNDGMLWCGPVDLAAGQTSTGQLQLQAIRQFASLSIAATVAGPQVDPTTSNNTDTGSASYSSEPALSATQTKTKLGVKKKEVYTMTVRNTAPALDATNVALHFPSAPNNAYGIALVVSAGVTYTIDSSGYVHCTMGTLKAGETRTVTFTVKTRYRGSLVFQPYITSGGVDRNTSNNQVTLTAKIG